MVLYPNCYLKKATQITLELLKENHIQGIILDVDNTLIDLERNLLEGIEQWCKELKEQNIKFCILSNSNHKDKVKAVAEKLQIPYFYFGMKPLKKGFKKAIELLNLPVENIAVVGDQIFTDIVGANRCHMYSILVEPVAEKDLFITRIKRPLEKHIMKKYQMKQEQEEQKNVF